VRCPRDISSGIAAASIVVETISPDQTDQTILMHSGENLLASPPIRGWVSEKETGVYQTL